MKFDWIFFDYGGTLTVRLDPDSESVKPDNAYGQVLADWFPVAGRDIDADADELQQLTELAHRNTEGRPNAVDVRYNEYYYIHWMRWIYEQLNLEPPFTDHELAAAWHFMCWQIGNRFGSVACESVKSALTELSERGYRLGVLSNNSGYVADQLALGGIYHMFEIIVDSAREGRVKPDPELFRSVASRAGATCDRIFYVGDSYECDVIGATLVGMSVAWIGGDNRRLPKSAVVIDTFAELLDHL
ncbi:MAG: HAD family hydrolase [Planctomycetota bacterium]|jgi:FMN phosphatase YigB (HAD superfamily)|nr:HAD family hydrolase [Planctomycetota bacterium]